VGKRPALGRIASGDELRDWYWLKEELIAYCRKHKLKQSGSKAELTGRIASFIDGGRRAAPREAPAARPVSEFDWARASLTPETLITDSYTNGPNTRAFFVDRIGKRFRFNIEFMRWMKQNIGKTLADAADEWLAIEARRKSGQKSDIPSGNQFNQYVRDFFDANPGRTMAEARSCWLAKRKRRGKPVYEASDLRVLR